ncbi:MAG: hypothetical protein IJ365_02795 [Clostridia bacterium]|nr:hypothetical protein [Clostridia bacterium]
MKLFKTSLISYLIIFSLIFTQVFPAFAQGLAEQTSQDSQTLEQSCDEDMWQYSPDNIDSIAYVSDEDEGFDETAEGDSDSNGEAAADTVEESEEQATDTAAAQLAADEGEAQAAELFEAEEEQEAAEDTMFEDVSHMSDEEFFGQWDMEREEWVVQGKLNYDYSPDLAEVERLVKNNSYSLAKDALLEYYRNRSNIPRAETNASIGWARNTLNMRDAYSFQETLITYTNITNTDEYQEYTVDLLTDVSSSVFLLSSITKTEDMVSIASRESEYSPKLVIVCEDGTSVTLDPVKDTYIRGYDDTEDYSKNIYGLSKELYVKDSWYQTESGEYKPYSSKTRRAYIGFDSDKFPGDIERMYLKFYAKIVPEEGVETTTETNHEIMVFSAYNKSWDEVKSANNEFDPMNWADYKIAHYSWNGLPGGFDWKRPDNVPSEFFNENSRFYGATSMARSSLMTSDRDYMRKSIEVTLDFIQDTNGDIMVAGVPSGRDIESANRCCEIPGLFAIWLDSDIFDSEAMTAILKWLWEEMTYLHNGAGILYQGATALPTSNNYAETNRGLWHVMGTEGVCTYFPEYADRDMWKEVANERLDVVGHVLVNDDGCYQEATFSYAISMITYFINIYRFMQDSGEVVPDWYVDRIGNFARYIMYVSFPNHTPPKYGEGAPGNTVATLKKYLNLEDDEEIEYVATDGADGVEPPTSADFQQLKWLPAVPAGPRTPPCCL